MGLVRTERLEGHRQIQKGERSRPYVQDLTAALALKRLQGEPFPTLQRLTKAWGIEAGCLQHGQPLTPCLLETLSW